LDPVFLDTAFFFTVFFAADFFVADSFVVVFFAAMAQPYSSDMANVSRVAGLSRRRFLARSLGAGAATFFAPQILAACGGGGGSATDLTGINLVKRFPGDILVPGRLRLPFSLADSSGVLTADSTTSIPEVISFVVTDIDGNSIGLADPLVAPSHVTDVPQPYWPLEVTIDKAGLYLVSIVGSDQPGASIQLVERSEVGVPLVGDPLPAIDTPTTDDLRDVDPVCTREPACPLHDITLREALTLGKPVAYLLGTPAYCQTGTCSPALDAILEVREKVGDTVTFVHAEIYTDRTATTPAKAVTSYNMTYEPALFVTDANGVLTDRLDAIFDARELRAVFARNGIS
jgi:hypothetical protein